jgi:hypothetical protein
VLPLAEAETGAALPTSSLAALADLVLVPVVSTAMPTLALRAVVEDASLAVQETDAGSTASTCPVQTTRASSVTFSVSPKRLVSRL